MAEVAAEHSADWQGLGVAVLHRLLVDTLLGAKGHPKPEYVHLVEEVEQGLETGEFPLAALVMPATVEHIRLISQHGERMPAKSTYFYPKLLGGLGHQSAGVGRAVRRHGREMDVNAPLRHAPHRMFHVKHSTSMLAPLRTKCFT